MYTFYVLPGASIFVYTCACTNVSDDTACVSLCIYACASSLHYSIYTLHDLRAECIRVYVYMCTCIRFSPSEPELLRVKTEVTMYSMGARFGQCCIYPAIV